MTNIYESVIADTSYEAQQIAKEKFGDNFEIVNEERFKDSICFGFGKQERVKITVKVNSNQPKKPFFGCKDNYLFPTPNNRIQANNNYLQESQQPYEPKQLTVPPITAKGTYSRIKQGGLRSHVDGIHGLQEGDDEPQPQKLSAKSEASEVENMLNYLKDMRKIRTNQNHIGSEIKSNRVTSQKLEDIQNQLDILTSTLTNLAQNSSLFLHENQMPQGLCDLEKGLLNIETPQEIIKELFRELRMNCDKETLCESKSSLCALHRLIKERLSISSQYEIKKSSKPQVIVLMGPTGVGKTTTIAKLAAKYCFNPSKPIKACFINIDFYKLGAKAQLQKYAEIFNIPLEDITSVASLDYCLKQHKDDDLIIVDTAGRSQYAFQDLKELKLYLDRIPNATKYLTVSSTSKYSDLKEIINSFGQVGFDQIILTKTDETKTIGPAVGMLLKTNKSLAYITHGQSVPEDYRIASFDFFEERIFKAIQNPDNYQQII